MQFHEKLDFLMKVTDTQNAVLARSLSFDTSYISRIRSGKRNPPRRHPFLESAAAYFAQHITGADHTGSRLLPA